MNIYLDLYEIIDKFVFNFTASTNINADLVCTLCATIGCVFLIALPFILVWKIIKTIC